MTLRLNLLALLAVAACSHGSCPSVTADQPQVHVIIEQPAPTKAPAGSLTPGEKLRRDYEIASSVALERIARAESIADVKLFREVDGAADVATARVVTQPMPSKADYRRAAEAVQQLQQLVSDGETQQNTGGSH